MTKISLAQSSFQLARSTRFSASPRARRALLQRNLDGKTIIGSGPNGRIIEADVWQFQAPVASLSTAPEAARSTPAASHLRAEVNATNLLKLSAKFENLSITDLLLKVFACAQNSENEIGFAGKNGVISIPDAQRLTLFELAKIRSELSESEDQSTPAHVLFNAGRGRIDEYDATLCSGQKSALGVGAIAARPFVMDGNLEVCATIKLSFAFDASVLAAIEAAEIFERIIELAEELVLLAFY